MLINFTKMHSLGNDFVVIDLITQNLKLKELKKNQIIYIANRHLGIGCDQILCLEPPLQPNSDFYYRIYNADGSEAEQCGNGALCLAKFMLDRGLTNKKTLYADCLAGQVRLHIGENYLITVSFDNITPNVNIHNIDYLNNKKLPGQLYYIPSMGNPHVVCLVENIKKISINPWGKTLSSLPIFPQGANIGFMQIIDKNNINLIVYERGVGMTLACGSGACAALLVGYYLNLLNPQIKVKFYHGNLLLKYENQAKTLHMSGFVKSVYAGHFRL